MCCDVCARYEKCEEDGILKDNCCSKCLEYYECAGMDNKEKNSLKDMYRDTGNDEYFRD